VHCPEGAGTGGRWKVNNTKTSVTRYTGGNEYIDRYLEDEVWWIVQGPTGRRPIEAGTAEEALAIYNAKERVIYGMFNLPSEERNETEQDSVYL
jgi:hypothetical protein